jgi:hypothetical protein
LQLTRRHGAAGKQVARRYANTAQILEFKVPGWWPGDVTIKQRHHHDVTDSNTCVAALIENDDRRRYVGW